MPKSSIPSTHFHLIPTLELELEDADAPGFVMRCGAGSTLCHRSTVPRTEFKKTEPGKLIYLANDLTLTSKFILSEYYG